MREDFGPSPNLFGVNNSYIIVMMAASEIILKMKTFPSHLLVDKEFELQAYLRLFLIPLQNHLVNMSVPPVLKTGRDHFSLFLKSSAKN